MGVPELIMVSSKGDEPCEDLPTARCLPRAHSGRDRDGYSHTLGSHTKDANKMERVCYNRMVGATEQRCEGYEIRRACSEGSFIYARKTRNAVLLRKIVSKKEENRERGVITETCR